MVSGRVNGRITSEVRVCRRMLDVFYESKGIILLIYCAVHFVFSEVYLFIYVMSACQIICLVGRKCLEGMVENLYHTVDSL